MFFLNNDAVELVIIFLSFSLLIWYFYYLYCFTYWRKKGVPTIQPRFPAGNILKPVLGQENISIVFENYYKEFKSKGYKHAGLYCFNGPVYFPIDPEIIKSILTTDFEHFMDRGVFVDEKNFPLGGHLFALGGSKWKNLRNKLSPTFSSGKLKTMYEIFLKLVEKLVETVEARAQDGEVNIKMAAANFTADLIFNTAFGLESGTLEDPENELSKIVTTLFFPSKWTFFKTVLLEGLQNPVNISGTIAKNKSHQNIIIDILRNTIKQRDEKEIVRKDFLSLLLEIRDKSGLSFADIIAQCFVFFLAGFETSSATISFCIHELAHNQDLQDKLREELYENLGKDLRKYTYEDISRLPYLDKVFNETLRLHPVLGFLNRICVKPYQVPGTDVVIEEGTPVLIPILGIQRDPEYFPEPLKFDPERFSEDQSQVPFTFLPFGDGPRFCIGMRYGKLQTKLAVAALISQFKFLPSSGTPKYIKLDKFVKSLVMSPEKGITVKIVKLCQ